MATINPYLNFNGNAAEAFEFYKSVFGGELAGAQQYKDAPGNENMTPQELQGMMHIALPIGNGSILMGSDIVPSMGHRKAEGNNCYLSIEADSKEHAAQLFNGLSAGGVVQMPLEDTFWNAYFGMFVDKFGICWMVNYTYPQQ